MAGPLSDGKRSLHVPTASLAREGRERVSPCLADRFNDISRHSQRELEGRGQPVNNIGVKADASHTHEIAMMRCTSRSIGRR